LIRIIGYLLAIGLILAVVMWLLKNIVGLAGIALAIWGIRNWIKNKQNGVVSKKPVVLTTVGVVIGIAWFAASTNQPSEQALSNVKAPISTIEARSTPTAAPVPTTNPAVLVSSAAPSIVEQSKQLTGKVVKVVDGDTFDVNIDGKTERVRLLLVDTPETVDSTKPVQPFGPEASAFAKETLEGQEVKLEKDVSERDKYGRLLFYVYIGDKMFNEVLLEKGLARVAVYPPDVKNVDKFREIQKKAQTSGSGIWSIENYAKDDGYHDEVVKKPEPTKAPVEAAKPTPTPKAVAPAPKQNGNVYYKNCTAAREAGVTPLYEGDPGYSTKLDRDRDGVACE
jgi:micrococcal nuclease